MSSPALAHHSNSIFDLSAEITFQGIVSRYDWRNPHVYVYADVRDESGSRPEPRSHSPDIAELLRKPACYRAKLPR
jgi:hypothetical protein